MASKDVNINRTKEQERAELHSAIWQIANDLRGSVDGWDFKQYVLTTGTAITKVLPPVSRFSPTGERTQKRESVLSKLTSFFERFFDISGGNFLD
jgi:hypothetical protein